MTDQEEFEAWIDGRSDPVGFDAAYRRGAWHAWQAALASHPNTPRPIFIENAPSVAGWKLMPIEPTEEMLAALIENAPSNGDIFNVRRRACYAALLKAAPLPGENPRGGEIEPVDSALLGPEDGMA